MILDSPCPPPPSPSLLFAFPTPHLLSLQEHTHTYTHQNPFSTLPVSAHKPITFLFSTNSLAPSTGRSPQDHPVLLSPPRTVAWISSARSLPRHLHPLLAHLRGQGPHYLPGQHSAFRWLTSDFPFSVVLPKALSPFRNVKAAHCLPLRPVITRLKNSKASHHFCCDIVSCPLTIHSTFLSAPSRLRQGEVFPQTH